MHVYRNPGDAYPQAPATLIANALIAAEGNVMPTFTAESLIQTAGLAGDEPDGRQLVARLVGEPDNFSAHRDLRRIRQAVMNS